MSPSLEITYADEAANEFRCLGGAAWPTMAETRRQFRVVPETPDGPLVLDLLDRNADIVDDKRISWATAEALTGRDNRVLVLRRDSRGRFVVARP